MHGTARSGVAIAITPNPMAPVPPSNTAAHEMGHYLGLFHTSEMALPFAPQIHDPIDDTPENDTSYLMHASGSGTKLSVEQGKVMRRSPWVR